MIVRIIHDPICQDYDVEIRPNWWPFGWKHAATYGYDLKNKPHRYIAYRDQQTAFELAKREAERLESRSVVYKTQTSNW